MSSEFKVMYFISSNFLHDFLNDKYMLFSLKKKKKNSSEKYKLTWPDLQSDWPELFSNFFFFFETNTHTHKGEGDEF